MGSVKDPRLWKRARNVSEENQVHNDLAGEDKLIAHRRAKLDEMRAEGEAYPNQWICSASLGEIHARYSHLPEDANEPDPEEANTIAGRVMAIRRFGKAAFIKLRGRDGDLQVFLRKNKTDEASWLAFSRLDRGDHVGVRGAPFRTKTGELTLSVDELRLLVKSLRPLPEKWAGLTDSELRFRQRYVDLIVNPKVRETFIARAAVMRYIRRYFDDQGYIEVETPSLHDVAGGAAARPFLTHHNTLEMDLKLRIATELHLKRLVVGGMERVYEMGKNFRNEGISVRHNPEFTSIEFYEAYATVDDMMHHTEQLLNGLCRSLHDGAQTVSYHPTASTEELTLDFGLPFRRLRVLDGLTEYAGVPADRVEDREFLIAFAKEQHRIELSENTLLGKVQMELFDHCAEPQLINPTFVTDYPTDVSPLARRKDGDPNYTDRFELICARMELANAFSELNDPDDQRARFEAQVGERAKGDDEAHELDEDFLRALEYGMPPTAGEGIGIDRLVMLMTNNNSIREVILFPQLRRQG